jgi:orotate phosphoribosyltransferase
MPTIADARSRLLSLLRKKSVFHGDFVLSSGAKSSYYVDCKLTTLDPEGAWLTGQVMRSLIQSEAAAGGVAIQAVGGLTLGADPIALAVGMCSFREKDTPGLQTFIVRKTPKGHGQAKLIEGNFKSGDLVVVLDDVVTRGDSTIAAIKAVEKEGGKVAFVAVLVDRQEGGRENIERLGYRVVAAFKRNELIENGVQPLPPSAGAPA